MFLMNLTGLPGSVAAVSMRQLSVVSENKNQGGGAGAIGADFVFGKSAAKATPPSPATMIAPSNEVFTMFIKCPFPAQRPRCDEGSLGEGFSGLKLKIWHRCHYVA